MATNHQFELHAKTAEEIDPEKCNFRNFGRSLTLILTLDRVEDSLMRMCGQGLPTYQIISISEKLFVYGCTDGHTTPDFSKSIRPSPSDNLIKI